MDLRGIATFGFGVLFSMSLIKEQQVRTNPPVIDKLSVFSSMRHTPEDTITSGTPMSLVVHDDEIIEVLASTSGFNSPTNNMITHSGKVGSPLRPVSIQSPVMGARTTADNGAVLLSDALIRKVVEKAEMGRLMMDMDDLLSYGSEGT